MVRGSASTPTKWGCEVERNGLCGGLSLDVDLHAHLHSVIMFVEEFVCCVGNSETVKDLRVKNERCLS